MYKTLDISTTLLNNVAFVFFHVMETFSKDLLEVRGLRSQGFQLCCMSYNSAVPRILKISVNCLPFKFEKYYPAIIVIRK